MSITLGLVGGRGYTGEALLELLVGHPKIKIAWAASRSMAGQSVASVFPQLPLDLNFEALDAEQVAKRGADVIVLALPNQVARSYADQLPAGQAVIDLSADHRFDSDWIYGLPERNRQTIRGALRVANPGCYATAGQLGLEPLIGRLGQAPTLFGVSGFSGAGRTPNARNSPERLANNLLPYKLSGHVHEREIGHQLGQPVRFMPHVAEFFRGISMTIAAQLTERIDQHSFHQMFDQHYADEVLVEVTGNMPEVKRVTQTPRAIIGGFTVSDDDPSQVGLVVCLDNLLKGAASQALQNINLMLGLDELTGLDSQ